MQTIYICGPQIIVYESYDPLTSPCTSVSRGIQWNPCCTLLAHRPCCARGSVVGNRCAMLTKNTFCDVSKMARVIGIRCSVMLSQTRRGNRCGSRCAHTQGSANFGSVGGRWVEEPVAAKMGHPTRRCSAHFRGGTDLRSSGKELIGI